MHKKLNKYIAVILFICFSFSFISIVQPIKSEAALSLSINGMFETVSGGAPAGWEATAGTVSADSTDPYEGAYAMKLTGTTDFGAARALSLSANTSYIISFAYKTAGDVTANAGISYTGADTQSFSIDASTSWKTCQQEIITPAAFTASSLTFSASGSGELYIDRLEMWQSEQVYGGDMETLDGWTFYLSNPGVTMGELDVIEAIPDENGVDGNCIMIVNTVKGANPYLWKNVGNIYGEAVYEISADIRCENITTGGPGIKIEGYGTASDKLEMSFPDVGAEWETVSFQYKPVAGVNRIHLMPRLYGPGTVWFDNIHVRRVKSSESIISEPESLFFYSDETVGTEYLRLVDAYAPAAGGKIHMSIADATQIVWQNTVDVSTSVEIEFPISVLEVPEPAQYVRDADGKITEIIPSYAKQYTLNVEYLTVAGSQIASKSHTIQCYDRPTYLTKEGDFIKNGEKVIPVVGYHAPFDDIDRLSEIGVTVLQSAASKSTASIQKTLDEAQKYGVKVLVPLYEHMVPAAHEKNIELTKQAIRLFHDHPALFGWMVQDEPQPATRETNEMYELLQDSYNLIRSHDPDHPVYICECDATSFVMSGQCCDILSVDPYPNELRLIEEVYTTTVAAVNAVHGKKPVYNILQAWEWTGGWEPSADEIRNMAYLAMLGGAKGLGYYPVHDSDGDMFTQPLYEGVNSFAQKEQNILLGNTFNTSQTDNAFLGTMQSGSETYLLIASRSGSEISVSYDIGVEGGLSVINGGTATINGTQILATVPAHGAVLCSVSTNCFVVDKMNVSSINSGETGSFICGENTGINLAALYNDDGRLMHVLLPEESITADKDMKIKIFRWSDSMIPLQ